MVGMCMGMHAFCFMPVECSGHGSPFTVFCFLWEVWSKKGPNFFLNVYFINLCRECHGRAREIAYIRGIERLAGEQRCLCNFIRFNNFHTTIEQ